MKFKKIITIMSIIALTGCTAEYNLKFEENKITETVIIKATTEEENNGFRYLEENEVYSIIDQRQQEKYEKEIIKENQNKLGKFTYEYNFGNYKKSRFSSCYDAYTLTQDNGITSLSTSNEFKCMVYNYNKIDSLELNIETEYNVIENNADKVEGKKYTWYINDSNKDNKPIKFKYDTKSLEKKQKSRKTNYKDILLFTVITAAIAITIVLLITIRHKRVNKI